MQATYIKFILVVIFSFNFIFPQGSYNLSSDKSFGSIEKNENITIFKDNVIATNKDVILYANKAISYHESNKIILSGKGFTIHSAEIRQFEYFWFKNRLKNTFFANMPPHRAYTFVFLSYLCKF